MDSTARLPPQSPVPFPYHRDLRRNCDFLGEAAMQAEPVTQIGTSISLKHLKAAGMKYSF